MTTSPDHHHAAPGTPPPGCPAHGLSTDGGQRLYGPEADTDPRALYEKLREEQGQVARVLLHGDIPAWMVLGYHENLESMRNAALFSRDSRRWTAFKEDKVAEDSPLLPMVAWQPLCVFADGKEHARLRGAVTDSLARVHRHGMRRHVTRFTDQLVDRFEGGEADLVAEFAEHLPMLVMTQLYGMPEEYGPDLVAAARDLMRGTETAMESNAYVLQMLQDLVKRKTERPGPDFTTWLIQHSSALTAEEIAEHLRLVLVAANETTVNLITNTLMMVLTDRRFRGNLAGGQMTLPEALEQVMWDHPPLAVVPGRWATGDTELGGQPISQGDLLLLNLSAGNVDPAIRPDLSESVHGNRAHLAFSGGAHECPGQDIGRAIAETGIDALLTRLPDLELAVAEDELKWNNSWLSQHLDALPIRFTLRKPAQSGQAHTGRPGGGGRPVEKTAPAPENPARRPVDTAPATAVVPPPGAGARSGRLSRFLPWR